MCAPGPSEKNSQPRNPIRSLGSYSDCGPNRGTGRRAKLFSRERVVSAPAIAAVGG